MIRLPVQKSCLRAPSILPNRLAQYRGKSSERPAQGANCNHAQRSQYHEFCTNFLRFLNFYVIF
ncbi:hypothetical protein C4F51_05530 [Cellvibrio sp. KB43]|uniref:Uncharacterized protein n=1 Tax=Cellvibrio polysaccharolyticus TaxID=2082724 RepID=A0A928V0U2_9GAMM|nr:hypothetical protein [Cellvibrio polysaccharolyticus]